MNNNKKKKTNFNLDVLQTKLNGGSLPDIKDEYNIEENKPKKKRKFKRKPKGPRPF